ncbi:MAG TPA: choice-of-anchor tandem repeat GloVer-containing protein, partial [Candidatus Acidoferrum sp.]|nr:choice-of-anchor tandem repeat GloVer-containing protein [Candidatus Acidoferrum sp.]
MKRQRILPAKFFMMMLVLVMVFMAASTASAQTIVLLHTFDTEDAFDPTPIIEPGSPRFSGVIAQGRDGNLYSATPAGGTGGGAIYQITPAGALGWVISFSGSGPDGVEAVGGLTLGTDGNFYGTTISGGASNLGTIFKVSSSGVFTPELHSFNGNDGAFPYAPPVEGRDGNFYGLTQQGGTSAGAAYKITPAGVFTLLSSVPELPEAPLVLATDGNFYGTATGGGTLGYGTVFRMTSGGAVTTIHTFDQTNGSVPVGPVIQGTDDLLYGTTSAGGASGDGVVFKLTTGGKFNLLHTFSGSDGSAPLGGVVQASDGNFYGVTSSGGGLGFGAMYKITSTGAFTLLASFDKTNNGTGPQLTLVQHTNGSLYG